METPFVTLKLTGLKKRGETFLIWKSSVCPEFLSNGKWKIKINGVSFNNVKHKDQDLENLWSFNTKLKLEISSNFTKEDYYWYSKIDSNENGSNIMEMFEIDFNRTTSYIKFSNMWRPVNHPTNTFQLELASQTDLYKLDEFEFEASVLLSFWKES